MCSLLTRSCSLVPTWRWLCLVLLLTLEQADSAHAQSSEAVDPWRVMGLVSTGAPLRVTRRASLGQETFAPVFVDLSAVVFFPGRGALRHGPLLGYSTNLTIDGGFYAPVSSLAQHVLSVGYLGRYALNDDWHALAHVALPFDVSGSGSVGAELSAGLAYRVLSGFGAFTALSGNLFGEEGGVGVLAAFELGVFLDYEVLP
jgi:hypothetical protein